MDPAVGILIGAADAPSLAGNAAAASSSTTSCYHRGITVRSFACTCRVTAPGRRPDLAASACRRPRWRSPVRFSAVQPPVTEDHRWTSLRACRARKGSCAKPRAGRLQAQACASRSHIREPRRPASVCQDAHFTPSAFRERLLDLCIGYQRICPHGWERAASRRQYNCTVALSMLTRWK